MFNTKMGPSTSLSVNVSKRNHSTIDSSTTAGGGPQSMSFMPKIPYGGRFAKYVDGRGPLSNYQNVELFKIPNNLERLILTFLNLKKIIFKLKNNKF